jgi:phosphoglycerate dehydrogenase-like enzyme
MNFIASDPYADKAVAASLGVELVDLETLFSRADFLAVNCPLIPSTAKVSTLHPLTHLRFNLLHSLTHSLADAYLLAQPSV